MTNTEKLNRIAAKCRELISIHEGLDGYYTLRALAGWRTTIAAIEFAAECEQDGYKAHALTDDIIAAWPEELL